MAIVHLLIAAVFILITGFMVEAHIENPSPRTGASIAVYGLLVVVNAVLAGAALVVHQLEKGVGQ